MFVCTRKCVTIRSLHATVLSNPHNGMHLSGSRSSFSSHTIALMALQWCLKPTGAAAFMPLCASVHFLLQHYEYGAACPKPFWPSRDQAEVQFIPGGLLNPSGGGDRVILTFGLRSFNLGSRGSSRLWSPSKGLLEGLASCWREKWRGLLLLFGLTRLEEGLVEGTIGSGMRDFMYDQNLCFNQVEPGNLKLSKTGQGEQEPLFVNDTLVFPLASSIFSKALVVQFCLWSSIFLQILVQTYPITVAWRLT